MVSGIMRCMQSCCDSAALFYLHRLRVEHNSHVTSRALARECANTCISYIARVRASRADIRYCFPFIFHDVCDALSARYTAEAPPSGTSVQELREKKGQLYREMNTELRRLANTKSKAHKGVVIRTWGPLVLWMLSALAKLDNVVGIVYRGRSCNLAETRDKYKAWHKDQYN